MATQLQSNIKLLVLKLSFEYSIVLQRLSAHELKEFDLRQGISTSDELGSFHASFNPLQPAQPFSTGNWLIDPTPEEHLFLRQNKLESITFLLRIKPLTFHSSVENLRVARGHVATKSPSPRVMARHLAESIVVHELSRCKFPLFFIAQNSGQTTDMVTHSLKVKFRCSESLMKAHITPVDHQKTHGDSFEVVIRLSQSECVVSWTIFRRAINHLLTFLAAAQS
ncbi:hypothetical protein MJO29_003256 [Puccinia striiformis f. sp. tritici]|uniref:Uncharacterized protein n=1 Tax=Puccinia striiformis TaxID=27350 RepID=A0A2S4UNT3_9BASI|nr:hypothetical protein MJO29_003256 [Puccinia striiformis f. sp. tritici]POV98972.1 hypothetical protein PSHT_13789 [Puccinia striiformis]